MQILMLLRTYREAKVLYSFCTFEVIAGDITLFVLLEFCYGYGYWFNICCCFAPAVICLLYMRIGRYCVGLLVRFLFKLMSKDLLLPNRIALFIAVLFYYYCYWLYFFLVALYTFDGNNDN